MDDAVATYYNRFFPWDKLAAFYRCLPEAVGYFPAVGKPWLRSISEPVWPGVPRAWPASRSNFISINTSGYGALRFDFDVPESMCAKCGCMTACDICLQLALEWAATALRLLSDDLLDDKSWAYMLSFSGRRGFHLEINKSETCRDVLRAYVGYMNYSVLELKAHLYTRQQYWQPQLPHWEARYETLVANEAASPLLIDGLTTVLNSTHGSVTLSRMGRSLREWIDGEIDHVTKGNAESKKRLKEMLLYQLFCPRLDVAVTCDPKHMCKLPHSIHLKTRRIAMTIDHRRPFRLADVPTVDEVVFGEKPAPVCQVYQCDSPNNPLRHLRTTASR